MYIVLVHRAGSDKRPHLHYYCLGGHTCPKLLLAIQSMFSICLQPVLLPLLVSLGISAAVFAGNDGKWTRFIQAFLKQSSSLLDERFVEKAKMEAQCAFSVDLG